MSEKRFTSYYERGNEVVIEENGKRISSKKVVEKLNEQQATIEQLNLAIDDLLSHTSCDEIKKENEQLKKENRMLKKDLNKLYNLLMDKGMSHNELQDVLW